MMVFEDIIGNSGDSVSSSNIADLDDDWERCPICGATEVGVFATGGNEWLMWCAVCNHEWEMDSF